MKCTFNGLDNYKEIRHLLLTDSKLLKDTANTHSGHLGDVISSLLTTQSSISLKIKILQEEFGKQKAGE